MRKKHWPVAVLGVALLISVGFNAWQSQQRSKEFEGAKRTIDSLEETRNEYSFGHIILTNGTVFGDVKRALAASQAYHICAGRPLSPGVLLEHGVVASARMWDAYNLGRWELNAYRENKQFSQPTKYYKAAVRKIAYEKDILPATKRMVRGLCGGKPEANFLMLQENLLEALYTNIGYAIFD